MTQFPFILILIVLFTCVPLRGSDQEQVPEILDLKPEKKTLTWIAGAIYGRQDQFTRSWHKLQGNFTGITFGLGQFADNYYLSTEFFILQGPYDRIPDQDETMHFEGAGLTVWMGVGSKDSLIRTEQTLFGLNMGLSYMDINGRSISSEGSQEIAIPNNLGKKSYVHHYRFQSIHVMALPGVYMGSFKQSRDKGNQERLLDTRIEGYRLNIYVSIPLFSHYRAKYDLYRLNDVSGRFDTAPEASQSHGDIFGYTLFVSLSVMLGV